MKLQKASKSISKRIVIVLVLQLMMLAYSWSGVFTKFAAGEVFLSFSFFLYYAVAIGILFLYALLWQLVLRRVSLTTAYANRAVTVIWSIVWGSVIFKEKVSTSMIVGVVIIAAGIFTVVTADE